jgi:type I restriction enzyme S subunit
MPIAQLDLKRLEHHILKAGDLVITRTGAYLGQVGLFEEFKLPVLAGAFSIRFRINSEVADPLFLRYYFNSKRGQAAMQTIATGSAQPNLNIPRLHSLDVPLPTLPEQQAIIDVLSSLDDKIDLLHRQNKTLKALAETLFRQWFIEEAEEDWEELSVSDVATLNASTVSREYEHQQISYLDTSSVTEGQFGDVQLIALEEAPSRAKRLVKHNDVLISTVRPNQRHFGMVKKPIDNFVASTGFCVLTATGVDPHFLYLLLTGEDMTEFLHSIAEGSTSTYPSLKPSDLGAVTFLQPPKTRHDEFAKIAAENWDKITANALQIRTLEKLRETLLPKLMSGEVKVI